MGKKGLGILTTFIIAGLITGWFFFSKESQYIGTSALRAVPLQTPLIIDADNVFSLTAEIRENPMWKELSYLPGFEDFISEIYYADSIFSSNKEARNIFKNKSLVIAFGLEGRNSINKLYLMELDNISEKNEINSLFKSFMSSSNAILYKRKYENTTVYDYKWNKGKTFKQFSYAFCKGLFISSKNSIRVNEAIRQLNTESLIDDPDFARVNKTAGNNAKVNLYLNHKTFPWLLSLCLDKSISSKIKNFNNYATWTEVDLNQSSNEIMLNGFTFSDITKNNYLNIFLHQEPLRFRMESILPAETSFFLSLNLSDTKRYFTDYEEYLRKGGKYYNYRNGIIAVKENTGLDAQDFIMKNLDSEAGIVYTRAKSPASKENRFFVVKTKSSSSARAELIKMLKSTSKKQNKSVEDFTKKLVIDKQTTFDIFKMPENRFGEIVFGPIFKTVSTEYFTFFGNYLIMGDSFRSVSDFIRANVLRKVLENDKYYRDFSGDLSQKLNFYLWISPGRAHIHFSDFLSDKLGESLSEKDEHLRKIESAGWQFSPENGMIYNTTLIRYNPDIREKPETVWQSHLENEISFKPQFVINHNDRANREVVVQDKNNNLYLINKVGRVLWKINLPGQILGEVHQIDF